MKVETRIAPFALVVSAVLYVACGWLGNESGSEPELPPAAAATEPEPELPPLVEALDETLVIPPSSWLRIANPLDGLGVCYAAPNQRVALIARDADGVHVLVEVRGEYQLPEDWTGRACPPRTRSVMTESEFETAKAIIVFKYRRDRDETLRREAERRLREHP